MLFDISFVLLKVSKGAKLGRNERVIESILTVHSVYVLVLQISVLAQYQSYAFFNCSGHMHSIVTQLHWIITIYFMDTMAKTLNGYSSACLTPNARKLCVTPNARKLCVTPNARKLCEQYMGAWPLKVLSSEGYPLQTNFGS